MKGDHSVLASDLDHGLPQKKRAYDVANAYRLLSNVCDEKWKESLLGKGQFAQPI
jgi:hypothetical protein